MKRLSILGLIIITFFLVSCAPVDTAEVSTSSSIEKKVVTEDHIKNFGLKQKELLKICITSSNCRDTMSTCKHKEGDTSFTSLEELCGSLDKLCQLQAKIVEDLSNFSSDEIIEIEKWQENNPIDSESESTLTHLAETEKSCQQSKPRLIGDEILAGEFKWKITKITKEKQIGQDLAGTFFGVKADGEFLIVDVEVENIGKSANILSDSYIKLVDNQGREFTADTMASFYLEQGSSLIFDTVNPGIVKKGKVVFDVPVGLSVVDVKIYDSLATSSFYTVKLIS